MDEKRVWLDRETVEKLQQTLCRRLQFFAERDGLEQTDVFSKALHRLWEVSRDSS